MKKSFLTLIDNKCMNYQSIFVSGGCVGKQIEISPSDIIRLTNAQIADLTL